MNNPWLIIRGLSLALVASALTAQSALAFLPGCDFDKPILNMDGLARFDTDGTANHGLAAIFTAWQRRFPATRNNDKMCSGPGGLATEGTCIGRCDETDIDTLIQYE
jgi:hypothetical protein